MGNWYYRSAAGYGSCVWRLREKAAGCLREKVIRLVQEERGDLVSSLGWMAIMALVLIVVKGLVDGGLTRYVNTIFTQLDKVFNP